ncbi:MAG: serine hydrolase [Cytophagales bacterium]|nr:serine hydrolase [Cytophagales bacterium]
MSCFSYSNLNAQQYLPSAEAAPGEDTLSFWDIPVLKKAYFDASPNKRMDGIPVGQLGVNGGDKTMILKLAEEMSEGKHGNFDGLLIAHKGQLLFEYYGLRGRINLPHPQASATKTYTSLALGRAIQMGYLTMADLNKPLVSFLDELDPSKFVAGAELITLKNALTMTTGIRIPREQWEAFRNNPEQIKGQQEVQAILEHSEPITKASQKFLYGTGPGLIMQVIETVVPGSAKDFIKRELLDKLGITNYQWQTAPSGLPEAGWRTSMTSRDMIKWGTLARNRGKWNGEQLIPASFIETAIHRIVRESDDENFTDTGDVMNIGYGYFWWQADLKVGNKSYFSTSAQGGSGQYIVLIEELDLMVVTTVHRLEKSVLQLIADRILPAFIPTSSKEHLQYPPLEDRYLGQNPPGLTPELFAPGIVSTEAYVESRGDFSPDMTEFYFTRYGGEYKPSTLFVTKYENGAWSEAVDLGTDLNPYRDRFIPGWSEMKRQAPYKDLDVHGLSVSANGTYYLDEYTPEGDGPLRVARLINGEREAPKLAPEVINTGKWVAHPYIAPDESYLIFDVEREGDHGADIYISFRQPDGSWGTAVNMGVQINTGLYDQSPRVTPDGKYLFFWKGEEKQREDGSKYLVGSPYWVDARIIETFRAKQ